MRHILVAVALVAVASAPAAAQPTPWSPERFTAGWVFTPAVVFGGMWDSNVTIRNEDTPRTAEMVGVVNPRGEIDFMGKRTRFSAGYSGTLEAYRKVAELTRYDQRGRLEARHRMTPRLEFSMRQSLTITPTTDQLDLAGLPYIRAGSRMFDARSGFVYALERRTRLTADYTFQWVNFARPNDAADFQFLQGGHSHSPGLQLTYAVAERFNVGGGWHFRRTLIDGGEQIFNVHEGVGTAEFDLGAATKVNGKAGVSRVNVVRRDAVQVGPSYGLGLSHRRGRMTLGAQYERALLPSFGFGSLTASQQFHTQVLVPFAQGRMYGAGGFSWRRSDPAPEQGLTITLDSYLAQSSFGYFIARWLRMEAFYALTRQKSSAQGNVHRTRVGVQFVTFKPVRMQ